MKRFFIICLAILMLFPTSVHAEGTQTWSPSHVYGEKENGLYVRTLEEEIEGCPEELQYQEITAVKMARMNDELSKEMEEAGYFLQKFTLPDSGEIAYYPSEPVDQTPDGVTKKSYYKKAMKERADEIPSEFGYFYVKANAADLIKETETDICLIIEGKDVLGYYEYELLAINDYELSTTLPIGSYEVLEIGVKNDYKSEYPVIYEEDVIEIKEAGATLFTFEVGESVYEATSSEIEEDIINEDVQNEEEKSSHKTWYTIAAYIIVVIVLLLLYHEVHRRQNEAN